jgi:hypothetical protein
MPSLEHLRIFGSLVYYKEPSPSKLQARATPYYLIGYISSNIYKLCNPKTNKVITARDCKVLEGYFYKPNNTSNIQEIFTKLGNNNNNPSNIELPQESSSEDTSVEEQNKPKANKPKKTNIRKSSRIVNKELENYSEDELALTTSFKILEEEEEVESSNLLELDNSNTQD